MKNQKFNINRFITYAKYNLTMNSRLYLSQLGSVTLITFFILFFSMLKNHSFNSGNWGLAMMVSGGIVLMIIIANAFPALRKKETQINYYMGPASILEKFTFEFILRYVGFIILFPIIFFLMGKLVYPLVDGIRVLRGASIVGMEPISSFNLDEFTNSAPSVVIVFGQGVLLFVMSLIFAAPAIFMKNPMLKMIGFVMALMALVGYYFYILFEHINLGKPAIVMRLENIEESQVTVLVIITSVLLITTVLSYAFFKLKEREV